MLQTPVTSGAMKLRAQASVVKTASITPAMIFERAVTSS